MADNQETERRDGAAIIKAAYGMSSKKRNRLADAALAFTLIGLVFFAVPVLIFNYVGLFGLFALAALSEMTAGILVIAAVCLLLAVSVTGFVLGIAGLKRSKSLHGNGRREALCGIAFCSIEIIAVVVSIALFVLSACGFMA